MQLYHCSDSVGGPIRSDEGQVKVVNNKMEFPVWSLFYKLV